MSGFTRPEVTGRRAGLSGASLPPAFLPVDAACRYLGVSRTRLYEHLAKLDPDIIVQLGGRTVVDVQRATALIASMPRGPRKPPKLPRAVKGKRRPPKS
jgi:hypothetical protein